MSVILARFSFRPMEKFRGFFEGGIWILIPLGFRAAALLCGAIQRHDIERREVEMEKLTIEFCVV